MEQQHGFCLERSTPTLLCNLVFTPFVFNMFKNYAQLVSTDFVKGFDLVNHVRI